MKTGLSHGAPSPRMTSSFSSHICSAPTCGRPCAKCQKYACEQTGTGWGGRGGEKGEAGAGEWGLGHPLPRACPSCPGPLAWVLVTLTVELGSPEAALSPLPHPSVDSLQGCWAILSSEELGIFHGNRPQKRVPADQGRFQTHIKLPQCCRAGQLPRLPGLQV